MLGVLFVSQEMYHEDNGADDGNAPQVEQGLVEEFFELDERLVGSAALGRAIEEVLAQRVDHQHTHHTSFDHAIEVPDPLLVKPELGVEAVELLRTFGRRLGRYIPGLRRPFAVCMSLLLFGTVTTLS